MKNKLNVHSLFKAKVLNEDRWVEGYYFVSKTDVKQSHNIAYYHKYTKSTVTVEVDPMTICQCSLLKDALANYIYYGDVVEFMGQEFVVLFENGSFVLRKSKINWYEIAKHLDMDSIRLPLKHDNTIALFEIAQFYNYKDAVLHNCKVIKNIYDKQSKGE